MSKNRIHILPENVRNQIAAGEVVERPVSVVKELIENAIDAGSSRIEIEVEEGGRKRIRVSDDGMGMTEFDASLACQRHATSKISSIEDLELIKTLGFRGEALSSISAISRVRITSAAKGTTLGTEVRVHGGAELGIQRAASPPGTTVEVEDLFYNVPVRRKFLKAAQTEFGQILKSLEQIILPYWKIHFRLIHNGQEKLNTPSAHDLRERLLQVKGQDWVDHLVGLEEEESGLKFRGFISQPPLSLSSRDHQWIYVNRRLVRSPVLNHAISMGYEGSGLSGRFPAAVLFFHLPEDWVDVNVHPSKREVRFRHPQQVHDLVVRGIRRRLAEGSVSSGEIPSSVHSRDERWEGSSIREPTVTYSNFLPDSSSERANIQETMEISAQRPFGQIDQTYIVAEVEGELHIIDQHAAHERLLYDQLIASRNPSQLEVQPLLIAEPIDVSRADAVVLHGVLPTLKSVGIEIEGFGDHSFLIRSAPAILGPLNGKEFLFDLLEDFRGEVQTRPLEQVMNSIAASMACHAAIKAHQKLSDQQMKSLLTELTRLTSSTCPHGRPIRVSFGQRDLEKMFARR